jgi:hypothetical protein
MAKIARIATRIGTTFVRFLGSFAHLPWEESVNARPASKWEQMLQQDMSIAKHSAAFSCFMRAGIFREAVICFRTAAEWCWTQGWLTDAGDKNETNTYFAGAIKIVSPATWEK